MFLMRGNDRTNCFVRFEGISAVVSSLARVAHFWTQTMLLSLLVNTSSRSEEFLLSAVTLDWHLSLESFDFFAFSIWFSEEECLHCFLLLRFLFNVTNCCLHAVLSSPSQDEEENCIDDHRRRKRVKLHQSDLTSKKKKLQRCSEQFFTVLRVPFDSSRHDDRLLIVEHMSDIDQKLLRIVRYWIFNHWFSFDNKRRKFSEAKINAVWSWTIDICQVPIRLGDEMTGKAMSRTKGSFDECSRMCWRTVPKKWIQEWLSIARLLLPFGLWIRRDVSLSLADSHWTKTLTNFGSMKVRLRSRKINSLLSSSRPI